MRKIIQAGIRKQCDRILVLLAVELFLCNMVTAQGERDVWTLQSCIDYALSHNVEIRQRRISRNIASVNERSAQAAYFPSLSVGSSQRYSNRPYGDPSHHYNGSYDLTANWTLFDAGRQSNIDIAKREKRVADLNLQQSENTLIENIMRTYIDILYGDENVLTNDSSLQTVAKQMERSRILYEAGQIAVSEYAQMQSQYASQQYTLISARNAVRSLRLELCQLINVEPDYYFFISGMDYDEKVILSPLPECKDVYRLALLHRPEIKSSELAIYNAESSVKVARAGFYPTLSVGAGISTANEARASQSVSEQLKDNWSNSVGLTFNLPLLSGRQNKSALERAKLNLENSRLNLEDSRNNLLWTIENYWLDAQKAQLSYLAAKEKLSAARTSYNLVEQQYEVGLKNPTDLLAQRDLLLSAKEEFLKAKYLAVYNINMLRLYAGEPLL